MTGTTHTVQHDYDGEWITGTREDLYDGTNDDVLEVAASFTSRDQAEQYITDMCGLIHAGGDPKRFRIIEA